MKGFGIKWEDNYYLNMWEKSIWEFPYAFPVDTSQKLTAFQVRHWNHPRETMRQNYLK